MPIFVATMHVVNELSAFIGVRISHEFGRLAFIPLELRGPPLGGALACRVAQTLMDLCPGQASA